MKDCDPSPVYYIYIIKHPSTHVPFYVGKGKGDRYKRHERTVKSGIASNNNFYLTFEILSLLQNGSSPEYEIAESNLSEIEAYALEAALIDYHGLKNLTNILPGGIVFNPMAGKHHKETTRQRLKAIHSTPQSIERARKFSILGIVSRFHNNSFINYFNSIYNEQHTKRIREHNKNLTAWMHPILEQVIKEQREQQRYKVAFKNGYWIRNCPICQKEVKHKRRNDAIKGIRCRLFCLHCGNLKAYRGQGRHNQTRL